MDSIAQSTIELAARLAEEARAAQTRAERADAEQMARMIADPSGKAFTLAMADRVFRSHEAGRQSQQLRELLDRHGVPGYLPATRRWMLRGGAAASKIAPGLVMPAMQDELRRASSRVILDATP